MDSKELKQKYLRQNVERQLYEQFADYCEEKFGDVNLDRWTLDSLKNLITQFHKGRADQTNSHQTSFYIYQGMNNNDPLPEEKNNIPQQPANNSPPANIQIANKSATSLFDSVFSNAFLNSNQNQQVKPANNVEFINYKAKPKQAPFFPQQIFKTMNPSNSSKSYENWGLQNNIKNNPNNFNSEKEFASFQFFEVQPPSISKSEERKNNKSLNEGPKTSRSQNTTTAFDIDQFLNIEGKKQKSVVIAPTKASPYAKKHVFHEQESAYGKNLIGVKGVESMQVKEVKEVEGMQMKVEQKMIVKKSKIPYEGVKVIKQEFVDTVKCFLSTERKQLNHKELDVSIEKHQIIERSFLMSDYVMYHIKVTPLNVVCKRNYQDFTKLKHILANLYPGIHLAYLEKNSWFSSTSIEFIKKQKLMLEYFLRDLIQNKQIRNSRIFQEFITFPEHKQIKRKFQEYDQLEQPKGVEQLCLLDGKVDIAINENQRIYHQYLAKYREKVYSFIEKHKRLTETLAQQYSEISVTLSSLTDLIAGISDETTKFNHRVYDFEINNVQEVFAVLKKSYEEKKDKMKFEVDIITKNILPFLNYEQQNMNEFSELIDLEGTFFRSYMKRSEHEKVQVSMPYISDKLKQQKSGVIQQSKNIIVMKYQTGYLSNQLCRESQRIFETLGEKYKHLWQYCSLLWRERSLKEFQFWKSACLLTKQF